MADKFYITTAIAYTNSAPHIGFALELIQADLLSRYHRLKGVDTYFLTGTDEHGSKMQQTAENLGIGIQELADNNAAKFKELTVLLNLSNDDFIRTTQERHKEGARAIWKKLVDAGDIYKASYTGLYCVGCEAFVLEKDLIDGKCPEHMKEPEHLEEENYFFKLSKYSDQIKKLIESDELQILPLSRKNEMLSVCEAGLNDVSFSRPKHSLKWGIEVPDDPDHVMYVWCDALSNYVTALGFAHDDDLYKKFWPADVHLIGKGILRFHAGIWIGMLLSAGMPVPKGVFVHGYITSEGQKMSKSLGNVVDPVEQIMKYGAEALRYFLIREIPTTGDGDFSKDRFAVVYQSELANNYGNLVSRVLTMAEKYTEGCVPALIDPPADLADLISQVLQNYHNAFSQFDLKSAFEEVNRLLYYANKYVEDTQPWVLVKTDPAAVNDVIYVLIELIRFVTILMAPLLPKTADIVFGSFSLTTKDLSHENLIWGLSKEGTKVTKGEVLFPRIES